MKDIKSYSLTIIIPVYNKDPYLNGCLQSLSKLCNLDEIEVLIIDDGSTDNSSKIAKEFCTAYPDNFFYYYQDNAGVSAARNTGIEKARGIFVGFVDSDDIVEVDYFENLLKIQQKSNVDIAISDFEMVFSSGGSRKHRPRIIRTWDDSTNLLIDFFSGNYIGNNAVDKIFRKKLLTDNSILFPKGYKVGEDMFFVYQAIKKAQKVELDSSNCGYKYIFRDSSAMTKSFNDSYFDAVELSRRMIDDCAKDLNIRKMAEYHYMHEVCKLLENMKKNCADESYEKYFKKYLGELRMYHLPKNVRNVNKKQLIGLELMKISPSLYMQAHKLMKIG